MIEPQFLRHWLQDDRPRFFGDGNRLIQDLVDPIQRCRCPFDGVTDVGKSLDRLVEQWQQMGECEEHADRDAAGVRDNLVPADSKDDHMTDT